MRFLVDAQQPLRLARLLTDSGYDSVHTSVLPNGNRTTDRQITDLADAEGRVVVTKDRDFRDSHLLRDEPSRLLLISTGNITNDALVTIVRENLELVVQALTETSFVELEAGRLILHE